MSIGTRVNPQPLVNIALPIWKRLEYLQPILNIVEAQDYPCIELIVSDNGENGTKVHDVVKAHYSRPFRFRQNPHTVSIGAHFNQLLQAASGTYVVLLSDDDEISTNYISALVQQMEKHPEVSLAFGRQEIMNHDGVVIRTSRDFREQTLPGTEFIRRLWQSFDFGFESVGTFMTRSAEALERGGYPDFVHGNGIDNALVIKLCLDREVALTPECVWRYRVHESGYGWSVSAWELAAAQRQFMRFLDDDPVIRTLVAAQSTEWRRLKSVMVRNEWQTYLWRWRDIYRRRMSGRQWMRAAFAMPFIPAYYWQVAAVLRREATARTMRLFRVHKDAENEASYFERDK